MHFGNLGEKNQIFNNFPILPKVQTKGDIHVGSDVWFGESVTVMSGVTIGMVPLLQQTLMYLRMLNHIQSLVVTRQNS
jgi:hypothetical protein